MLRPENGPNYKLVQKTFTKGANTDIEKEFLPDGIYHDAQNMRPASVDGHAGSINKIGGEQALYVPNVPGASTYVCIGACTVTGRRVSWWASRTPDDFAPFIQIGPTVMAQSPNIPYVYNRPLQFGDVSKCTGGVIFPADAFSPAMFWDIPAIEQAFNAGEQTYLSDFTTDIAMVNRPFSAAPPVFRTLMGIGDGCPAGQYALAVRGRTSEGDVSNISLPTKLVSIPQVWDQPIANAYPGGRTTGGETDPQNPTPFHILVEYRLDNQAQYTEIEWILRRYNDGQGLNGPGETEIVARFQVESGLNPITQFVYPRDANVLETIPPDEAVIQQMNIIAPKAVEYVDNRVVYGNFQTETRLAEMTFPDVDGSPIFWVTKRLTTNTPTGEVNSGYTDPYHLTYNKSVKRGERHGIGIMPIDGTAGFAPVVPIGTFQAPNRRDPKTARSLTYSSDGVPAATTDVQGDEPVNNTFEAFEQGVFRKNDGDPYINVMAANGGVIPYRPWRPTSPTDGQVDGYNVNPNSSRVLQPGLVMSDTGNIWAPRYHALGVAINAVENIPSWTKAFAVMYTPPAGRVVMQGIGSYKLVSNPNSIILPANKSINEVWFFSKDAASGLVPQTVLEDIENNPQNYRVQVVSPLGFYNETYGYWPPPNAPTIAGATDALIYAGIQHDEGQVNVGEPAAGGMGVQPGPTAPVPDGNYTGWGVWRSGAPGPNLPWHEAGNDGNTLLAIDSFTATSDSSRSSYYTLKTDGFFYSYQNTNDQTAFQSADVRNFHEPFYVMNIIRVGAEVPDLNSQQYHYTGECVLMESCIGITTSGVQAFRLLNERMEDVRGYLNTEYRYVYVRTPGEPERAWVCVTGNMVLPVATVLADIAANGFWVAPDGTSVYGIYEAYEAGPTGNLEVGLEYVVFGGLGTPTPPANSRIIVKYDRGVVTAYGFDTVISPCINAPIDRVFNASGDNTTLNTGFLPMPYPGFVKNGNYILPDTGSVPQLSSVINAVVSMRQMCVLWDSESITPGVMDLFSAATDQAFPRIHYVIRPYRDINYTSGSANGFWPQYDVDYPNEGPYLSMGGLRFTTSTAPYNLDYSKQDKIIGVSAPDDFEERTDFCNGLIASSRLDPLQQNSPGLRTFLSTNLFLVSEENGEIKSLNALNSGGLQQLYGWAEKGVFKILYNQNILVGADGNTIGTQSVDQFWPRQEIWLSRGQKGMPGQFWRLSVKAHAPTGQGDADSVFWADRVSVYRLVGDSIIDIGRNKYLSAILPFVADNSGDYGVVMCSMYNQKHDEFWMSLADGSITDINTRQLPTVFVYNARNGEWTGRFTYVFDQYLCDQTTLMGMRASQTYQLDTGYVISGTTLEAWAETPYAPFPAMQTELVTFRVSPSKPDRIEVYDHDHNLMFYTDEALNGPLWIKYIDSWEHQVGRRNIELDPDQKRVQDFLFYKRVITSTAVPFRMTFSQFNAKQIP